MPWPSPLLQSGCPIAQTTQPHSACYQPLTQPAQLPRSVLGVVDFVRPKCLATLRDASVSSLSPFIPALLFQFSGSTVFIITIYYPIHVLYQYPNIIQRL